MLQMQFQAPRSARISLCVSLARHEDEVREAQRLRFKVFAEEMGARVPGGDRGIDCDAFDPHCEHLIVRDTESNRVVGTYRILGGTQARRIGRFYSDEEFDLTRLDHLREDIVEIGRSCVHADYRRGAAIALLWSGLAEYVSKHHYRYLIGCASTSMADGGVGAAALYRSLSATHLSPLDYRVFPRCALPLHVQEDAPAPATPPLIKAYLRAGAYICGAPAWDAEFNTADLPMMLTLDRLDARHARHFLKDGH